MNKIRLICWISALRVWISTSYNTKTSFHNTASCHAVYCLHRLMIENVPYIGSNSVLIITTTNAKHSRDSIHYSLAHANLKMSYTNKHKNTYYTENWVRRVFVFNLTKFFIYLIYTFISSFNKLVLNYWC